MFKFASIALLNTLAVANNDKPGESNGRTFNGKKYLDKTAQEKSDMIWEKVIESDESGDWHFAQTLIVDQAPVFKTSGDELECNVIGMCRHKTIHSVGNVAKIQWIDVGGHPYTGVFDGGADFGYVRFSTATPVDTETPNMRPGMGVKFLRDGVDSANFVAMFSVDGQDSLNWFDKDWSNHIPDPISPLLRPLEQRFSTQTDYIQTMGLSDFAAFNAKGERPAQIVFPWKLRFEATGQFEFPNTLAEGYTDYRTQLATIPSGTKLWNIYAMDKPSELGGTEQMIAMMYTASEMNPSLFGDNHLYFRHQLIDDDLQFRPEWEPYVPVYGGLFECPFKTIIELLK